MLTHLDRKCPHCRKRGAHEIVGVQSGTSVFVWRPTATSAELARGSDAHNPKKVLTCCFCGKAFNARATYWEAA